MGKPLNKPTASHRSLKRLVMTRPVKVRAIRAMQCDGKTGWTAFGRLKFGAPAMLVPLGEWALMKREAAMFRAMAREISAPWNGKITGLSPKAEELVKRRNAKRHNAKLSDGGEVQHG